MSKYCGSGPKVLGERGNWSGLVLAATLLGHRRLFRRRFCWDTSAPKSRVLSYTHTRTHTYAYPTLHHDSGDLWIIRCKPTWALCIGRLAKSDRQTSEKAVFDGRQISKPKSAVRGGGGTDGWRRPGPIESTCQRRWRGEGRIGWCTRNTSWIPSPLIRLNPQRRF